LGAKIVTFEEAMREAALVAERAVNTVMRKYKIGRVKHEDDLTGVLVGALDSALDGTIGGLEWDSSILTHRRGKGGEEKKYGGDLLIHVQQCDRMLDVTAAAFVFDYARGGMRCGPATRIAGTGRRDLYSVCGWTSYRFFLELFRCPVGDPRITSAAVDELPVRFGLNVTAVGEFSDEPETSALRPR
jgi:hypothetical protein